MPPRRSSGGGTRPGVKRKLANTVPPAAPALPTRIRYFDKDAISEHLYCSICQDVFSYPYALQCGHVFCRACISEWVRQQNNCPECRTGVDMRFSHRDLTAHKFLDSVPVYCSFLGCSWIGRMDALQGHLSECDCNPTKLPDYMVTREKADDHAVGDPDGGTIEGTTSLRMKLFKGEKRGLLDQAASGDMFIGSASGGTSRDSFSIPRLSDLTSDLITSSDIIARNRAPPKEDAEFVEISDED